MAHCDFVVHYNPETDTKETIAKKILYSVFIKRIKANKPVNIFMSGDSGEGKSIADLKLQELFMEMQGLDIMQYKEVVNVISPFQYADKLNTILFNKQYSKINVFCIHESREVIKAKLWHSFINQAISDINALQRGIKRMITLVTSQFIRDITNDVRYTLTHYIKVSRPKGKHSRLYINVIWKDDRDLDMPKLKRRPLSGYLVYPNGQYVREKPKYFEVSMPPKELVDWFEKEDIEAKSIIITKKIQKLMLEMKKEIGEETNKINIMVDWYSKNIESLNIIGQKIKGKWKIKPNIREMHDLTIAEANIFESKINEKIKKMTGVEDNGQQTI